ncbi:MAG: hypothetical protein ABL903_03935 [Methylococcales bacterium]
MSFEDAVTEYIAEHIGNLENDYQWRFPVDNLPIVMTFNTESWLAKNIALRQALHDNWINSTTAQRRNLCEWYITQWGGVRTNQPQTLDLYATATAEQLIARGTTGIASWSKALSIRGPERYAIYDARVSASLNAIQKIKAVSKPRYFPDLPSRNTTIVSATSGAKITVNNGWAAANRKTFYSEYNALLKNSATKIGHDITLQQVEMVLFSRAEVLTSKAWL